MEIDEKILSKLIEANDIKYSLYLDGKEYHLEQVNIVKSSIPVRKPTTRGGVYFSDTTAYKIKASLNVDGKSRGIILTTHLTNTMNSSTKLELNLIVDKTKLE